MNEWADLWERHVNEGKSEDEATRLVEIARQNAASNAPDALKQVQSTARPMPARPAPSLTPGQTAALGMNQVARGYTGGLSDRAIAGVASLLPGVTYQDARAKIDRGNAQFAEERPALNAVLNIGGAVLPGPSLLPKVVAGAGKLVPAAARGAGPLARGVRTMARGALGGAAAGAIGAVGYQGGEDDKSVGATVNNALDGAQIGGLVGGAAPAVVGVAKRAGSVLADLTGARQIRKSSVPEGMVPRMPGTGTRVERALDKAEGVLFPEQLSRSADRKIAAALTQDGRVPLDDLLANLRFDNIATGNKAMVADLGDDMAMGLARGAKTKSREASGALKRAYDTRDKALLSDLKGDLQATVGARVSPVAVGAKLRQEAKDASAPLYQAAERQIVDLTDPARATLLDRDPSGVYRAAHNVARKLAREAGEPNIPPLFTKMDVGNGVQGWVLARDKMEVREIDAIKKGIQELATAGTKSGKVLSKRRAKILTDNLDRLVSAADDQVPEYEQARAAFKGPMRQREAMNTAMRGAKPIGGKEPLPSFTAGSPEDLAEVVRPMNQGERDLYDLGKVQGIYTDLQRNPRAGLRRMNTQEFGDKLRATAQPRDAGAVDALLESVSRRNEMAQRAGQVMGGSPTADKLVDEASLAIPGKLGQLTYALTRGLTTIGAGRSLGGFQRGTANEVGKRMALQGPQAEAYLRYLLALEQQGANPGAIRTAARNFGRTSPAVLLGLSNQPE